jgi:hypothetical protein
MDMDLGTSAFVVGRYQGVAVSTTMLNIIQRVDEVWYTTATCEDTQYCGHRMCIISMDEFDLCQVSKTAGRTVNWRRAAL